MNTQITIPRYPLALVEQVLDYVRANHQVDEDILRRCPHSLTHAYFKEWHIQEHGGVTITSDGDVLYKGRQPNLPAGHRTGVLREVGTAGVVFQGNLYHWPGLERYQEQQVRVFPVGTDDHRVEIQDRHGNPVAIAEHAHQVLTTRQGRVGVIYASEVES